MRPQKDAQVCAIEALSLNSSELTAKGFTLREVFPIELEAAACRRSTRGAGICQLEGMCPKPFMLSVDDDNEFRSPARCDLMCVCTYGVISLLKKNL